MIIFNKYCSQPNESNIEQNCPGLGNSKSINCHQIGSGVQNEAGQNLTEFCWELSDHSKHTLPMTQEMRVYMDITDGQYWNQTDYFLCSWRWRSSIQSAKTRLGAHCGSDHEVHTEKFRLKSKKVGKRTGHSGMN